MHEFFQQYQINSARPETVEGTPNTFFNKLLSCAQRGRRLVDVWRRATLEERLMGR